MKILIAYSKVTDENKFDPVAFVEINKKTTVTIQKLGWRNTRKKVTLNFFKKNCYLLLFNHSAESLFYFYSFNAVSTTTLQEIELINEDISKFLSIYINDPLVNTDIRSLFKRIIDSLKNRSRSKNL